MSSEAKYVGEKEPEELWSHIEDVVAERDSLRAEMERMKLDEQMLSDDDDACHRLLDAALGEGSLATTSMETLLERLPRLIDERDSLRSQRDAARKELGDVLENLDLKSLNSALDEVRAQASEFSLALALEKVARAKAELERDALAEALEGAAKSLESASAHYKVDDDNVRAYCLSRATVARAALLRVKQS